MSVGCWCSALLKQAMCETGDVCQVQAWAETTNVWLMSGSRGSDVLGSLPLSGSKSSTVAWMLLV
jgi:hypothetical protein